jgi:phosphate transport system substrate-binding protein
MERSVRDALCMLITVCILALVPCANAAEAKQAVRVNGAAMASEQLQQWADSFTTSAPDIQVVVLGSSAGKGFEALFAGNAEVALASRPISAPEEEKANAKGMKLEWRAIGNAGLAVVTASRNPVSELTLEQLKKVFTGEYTNWNRVGGPDEPIRCLSRRVPESGGAVFFQRSVLHNQPFGTTTVFTETWGAILKVCSTAKDLPVGIGPRIQAERSGVKIIRIKQDDQSPAVLPSDETMKNKTYPISVPIRLYWNAKVQDDRITKFVEYCEKQITGSDKQ